MPTKHGSRQPWNTILSIVRVCAAVAPFAWIFSRVDLGSFVGAAEQVLWWTIAVVAANILIAMFLQGLRWWMLIRAFVKNLSAIKALSVHLKAVFYSVMLPTSAAQDIVRAALLSAEQDYGIVWAASWLCRLLGLLVLVVLSLVGLISIDRTVIPLWVMRTVAVASALIVALFGLSFSKKLTRPFRGLFARVVPTKVMKAIEGIRQAIYLYRGKTSAFAGAMTLTVVVQATIVLNAAILLYGIAGIFPLASCLFFIPAIEIAILSVPLTPNGIGIREGLYLVFLQSLGLSHAQMGLYITVSLLGILLRLVGVIPIATDMLRGRGNEESPKAAKPPCPSNAAEKEPQ